MITASYSYNGKVIGESTHLERLPAHLRIPTRHTLEDLLRIKLAPTNRPITCVKDTYQPTPFDLEGMMRRAYRRLHTAQGTPYPKFDSRFDRVRWQLERFLRRCGVIA